MSNLSYEKYIRKPFFVDVVEVTEENIEEIATMVGELREDKGKPYIQVNRNVVPGVNRVHPGYLMTKLDDNIRCYNRRVFERDFMENTPDVEQWVNYINDKDDHDEAAPEQDPEVGEFGRIKEPEVADG